MIAKIQKSFVLTIGSNHPNVTEEDILQEAFQAEQYFNGNTKFRAHIKTIDETKGIKDEE